MSIFPAINSCFKLLRTYFESQIVLYSCGVGILPAYLLDINAPAAYVLVFKAPGAPVKVRFGEQVIIMIASVKM